MGRHDMGECSDYYKEKHKQKTVEFSLNHDDLSFYNKFMELVVEPGAFEVMVGSSSEDIRIKGEFEVRQ